MDLEYASWTRVVSAIGRPPPIQDWQLRYELQSLPGVAEVAPIGGFVRQYQINLDPNSLAAFKISLDKVIESIKAGNNDVGGRLVEFSGREYMVRGRGYIRSLADIENIVDRHQHGDQNADPGEACRTRCDGAGSSRGIAELDGRGETVGGVSCAVAKMPSA